MSNLETVFMEKCSVQLNNLVFRTQKDSLSCFYAPNFFATDIGDHNLKLPQLQHLHLGKNNIGDKSLERILTSCPRLESLTCGTTPGFKKWNLLPPGFKRLVCTEIPVDSLSNFISSDAILSLQELTSVNFADSIKYWTRNEFPQLQRLGISVTENVKDSLESLTKFLRTMSRDENHLSLQIKVCGQRGVDVLPNSTLNQLLHKHEIEITHLTIRDVEIESSIEEFIEDLASSMKQLKKIDIDFPLSDKCLSSLSTLDHLQVLEMDNMAKRPYLPHQSIYGTRRLIKFLKTSFAKKLSHFESSFDLMQVPVSFIQELNALCDKQSIRMRISKYSLPGNVFRMSYLDLLQESVRDHYQNFH